LELCAAHQIALIDDLQRRLGRPERFLEGCGIHRPVRGAFEVIERPLALSCRPGLQKVVGDLRWPCGPRRGVRSLDRVRDRQVHALTP
jgi:hypothetical protein